MTKDPTTEKLINASIHVFYPTLDEAKRESFRTGDPYFTTYINGQKLHGVRPRGEVRNG